MAQELLAFAIVALCAVYAGWTLLLPAAWRRRMARALLRRQWPAPLQQHLQRAARTPSVCGCDDCDARPNRVAPGDAKAVQTVQWAPRRRR
jgi:hypothetical protein